jgi:hypothetical protein
MTRNTRLSRWAVLLGFALIVVALLAGTPGTAQAKCKLGCLRAQVASLTAQVSALSAQLKRDEATITTNANTFNTFHACLRRRGLTQYDGYEFNTVAYNSAGNGFLTTALDFTNPGSNVDVYLLRDTCTGIPVG